MISDLIILNTDVNYWRTIPDKYKMIKGMVHGLIEDESYSAGGLTLLAKNPLKQIMFHGKGIVGMTYILLAFSEAKKEATLEYIFEVANLNREGIALMLTHVIDEIKEELKEIVENSEELPWGKPGEEK